MCIVTEHNLMWKVNVYKVDTNQCSLDIAEIIYNRQTNIIDT